MVRTLFLCTSVFLENSTCPFLCLTLSVVSYRWWMWVRVNCILWCITRPMHAVYLNLICFQFTNWNYKEAMTRHFSNLKISTMNPFACFFCIFLASNVEVTVCFVHHTLNFDLQVSSSRMWPWTWWMGMVSQLYFI